MSYEIILDAFHSFSFFFFFFFFLKIGKNNASFEEFLKFCYDAEHA